MDWQVHCVLLSVLHILSLPIVSISEKVYSYPCYPELKLRLRVQVCMLIKHDYIMTTIYNNICLKEFRLCRTIGDSSYRMWHPRDI